MKKADKLYQKIKQGPNKVSPEDLGKLLVEYGFEYRDGTNHWRIYFRNDLGINGRVTIPYRRPLKAYVVKQALKLIEEIQDTLD